MAAAAVDVGQVSGFLGVPSTTIDTFLEAPTKELVKAILQAIATKATQFSEKEAESYRLSIELQQAGHSSQSRIDGLKATVDKSQTSIDELRKQVTEEGK